MSPLLILMMIVVVSAVGTLVLWARHRPTSSPHASVAEFNAKLKALSGDQDSRSDGIDRRGE